MSASKEKDDYERAMRRAMGRKPFLRTLLRTKVNYLTREEAHDRAKVRSLTN
jgi:hypothetical protein